MAIPLATLTAARVTNLYDLMDSAYDAPEIRAHSESLGHVAIIDANPRSASRKLERKTAARAQRAVGHVYAEQLRYRERTTASVSMVVSRTSSAVAKSACNAKVLCHLMFGMVALTVIAVDAPVELKPTSFHHLLQASCLGRATPDRFAHTPPGNHCRWIVAAQKCCRCPDDAMPKHCPNTSLSTFR